MCRRRSGRGARREGDGEAATAKAENRQQPARKRNAGKRGRQRAGNRNARGGGSGAAPLISDAAEVTALIVGEVKEKARPVKLYSHIHYKESSTLSGPECMNS